MKIAVRATTEGDTTAETQRESAVARHKNISPAGCELHIAAEETHGSGAARIATGGIAGDFEYGTRAHRNADRSHPIALLSAGEAEECAVADDQAAGGAGIAGERAKAVVG